MDFVVKVAEGFNGMVSQGGENLVGLIKGILPNLLILLTLINAIIAFIGEDRVMGFAQKITKYRILRYTVLPFMAIFFLTNPMCYTMGRFVEEKDKAAFIDSIFTFGHPILGLFPHANAGELFVWAGIAAGVTTLGHSVMPLAVRAIVAATIVAFIRGNVTEFLTVKFMNRQGGKKA